MSVSPTSPDVGNGDKTCQDQLKFSPDPQHAQPGQSRHIGSAVWSRMTHSENDSTVVSPGTRRASYLNKWGGWAMNRNRQTDDAELAVHIPVGAVELQGDLCVPPNATGVVLFAHGSGSGRHSRRNRHVAAVLRAAGFATLLADLLTEEEELAEARTAHLRFNIEMLAYRLATIIDWLGGWPAVRTLPIGLFGASTGGGAGRRDAASGSRSGCGVARRSPGPGRRRATGGSVSRAADCGQPRRRGPRTERRGVEAAWSPRESVDRGSWGKPSLRRTGYTGRGCTPRGELV